MRRVILVAALVATVGSGCGGSSSSGTPTTRATPDLAKLLAQPVASPSVCPSGSNAESVGRSSPWDGTVDVSVYLRGSATPKQTATLGRSLRKSPLIKTVYFESHQEAYKEFQRLYTCWTALKPSAAPSSYRLVLTTGVSIATRDRLVGELAADKIVDGVNCDRSLQCLAVAPTVSASPSSSSSP